MKKILAIASTLTLAGCGAHVSGPHSTLTPAATTAPLYSRSEFECAGDPVPPAGRRTNATAEKFMEQQRATIGDCRGQLRSVGRKATGAGLVR